MHSKHNIKFFTGRSSRYLSERIADSFGIPLGKSNVTVFSDGEFQPSFDESVRGCTVFIIQSTFPPVDNLFELLLMVDAAHRASAYKVVAVMPYFGWARQDRKDKPRVAIGAKMVANMLRAAGVDRIMTMDLHADQIQGFFDVPVDHLYASSVFVPYLKSLQIDNIAIASPDMGGAKRANAYARFMNASLVLCYKNREKANQVDEMTIIGDVRGKNVVILDDMVDTAGTLAKASGLMKD
ncbi:MAG TPA: ribose-phosphate pyrophosphokinase, partial [Tenuifilaceae bacterium]|nr:ribose-phosphate pyrophosphokinase [Tenuifilaceae bacterium]